MVDAGQADGLTRRGGNRASGVPTHQNGRDEIGAAAVGAIARRAGGPKPVLIPWTDKVCSVRIFEFFCIV